jgi:hypothetical protein
MSDIIIALDVARLHAIPMNEVLQQQQQTKELGPHFEHSYHNRYTFLHLLSSIREHAKFDMAIPALELSSDVKQALKTIAHMMPKLKSHEKVFYETFSRHPMKMSLIYSPILRYVAFVQYVYESCTGLKGAAIAQLLFARLTSSSNTSNWLPRRNEEGTIDAFNREREVWRQCSLREGDDKY